VKESVDYAQPDVRSLMPFTRERHFLGLPLASVRRETPTDVVMAGLLKLDIRAAHEANDYRNLVSFPIQRSESSIHHASACVSK
jgi:hypothetical protein